MDPDLAHKDTESHKETRGPIPTTIEWLIYCYAASTKNRLISD